MDKSYLLLVMFLLVQGKGIVTQDDPAQDERKYVCIYIIEPSHLDLQVQSLNFQQSAV